MSDYFIADLHLGPQRPHLTDLYLHFLKNQALHAKRLFILGDLFEYWLGDDAIHPHYLTVIEAHENLLTHGTQLFFMHGNRDFLIGETFCSQNHITLLNDPCVINTGGYDTLLSHGDMLCTDDEAYQQFRTMVRDPAWQQTFLNKSVEERMDIAKHARDTSSEANKNKSQKIMDVNPQATLDAFKKHGVTRMIHGHTHRPHEHHFEDNGTSYQRIVLADWNKQGHYLKCDESGCTARSFT